MKPDRWRLIEQLYEAARERAADDRPAFLARACEGDPSLLKEVESLLASGEASGDFLAAPALGEGFRVSRSEGPNPGHETARVGCRIGAYELTAVIASGGMGTVYRALRADQQFEKQVAIKLIRRGMDTEEIIHRFRSERQALASLDHPNIARLLDGGTTEDGLPFLVMEYIEGLPIDRYCDEHRLSTTQRLDLFRAVCAAVHYAHQSLVVHRDIKPGNILVTEEGRPKLLDFGVAKILHPQRPPGVRTTAATTLRFLTPEYASPEQIRGEPVTTATDVYSLGVVLYELLTGHLPYRFRTRAAREIERVICEEEPPKPSTAVRRTGTRLSRAAAGRTTLTPETISRTREGRPERLRRRLAGDLDTIVLMALRKEPARRYVSVQQFSEDIRRHLRGLPVTARKDTLRYRGAKFVRRHRTAVAAVCSVVLALIVGIVGTAREARRARSEADNASRAMAGLLRLVKTFDPTAGIGSRATFRQILDHGAENAARELEHYPEAQVEFMEAVAGVYADLSVPGKAVEWCRRVVEVQEGLLGEEDPAVLESRQKLGRALCRNRQHEDAERVLRETLVTQRRHLGDEHPAVADTLWELACALYGKKGRYDEAEPLFRKALAIDRKVLPDPHPVLIDRLLLLGGFMQSKGDYAEAEKLLAEALEQTRRLRPADDSLRARAAGVMGAFLQDTSRYSEAEPYRRECLEITRQLFPEDHPAVAADLEQLGLLLKDMERYAEAEPLIRQALDIKRSFFGEEAAPVAYTYHCLAKVLTDKDDLVAAEQACRKALALHLKVYPRDHRDVARPMTHLGRIRVRLHRYAEAEPLLREALETRRKRLPAGHWKTAKTESVLGACLAGLGRFEEAEPLLLNSIPLIAKDRGPYHRRTREALRRVVDLYAAWGKPREAEEYRARLAEAEARWAEKMGRREGDS